LRRLRGVRAACRNPERSEGPRTPNLCGSRTCKPRRLRGVRAACRNPERSEGPRISNLCGSRTCKPNSVCRIAPAGRPFLWATHYCAAQATYPEVVTRRAGTYPAGSVSPLSKSTGTYRTGGTPSLFGLAPCGVCPARRITATAVRSYRTFSPLPRRSCQPSSDAVRSHKNGGAVYFLWHFPSSDPTPTSVRALPDVIRHTALRSSDFPPRPFSEEPQILRSCQNGRGDRPVQLPTKSLYAMVLGTAGRSPLVVRRWSFAVGPSQLAGLPVPRDRRRTGRSDFARLKRGEHQSTMAQRRTTND